MPLPLPFPVPSTDAESLVHWAAESFGETLALACSTSMEDAVLTHLANRTGVAIRVFLLDTGRLHPETHETFQRLKERYPNLRYQVFHPEGAELDALTRDQGVFGFRNSLDARQACCRVRKVLPLARALAGAPAWLTGLRREQSPTRTDLEPVTQEDDRIKIAPLLSWTEEQLWAFVKAHQVPVHPLHVQGFPSIGCAPCTRAVKPGEDPRAGRWWWESPEHKECGLHHRPLATHPS